MVFVNTKVSDHLKKISELTRYSFFYRHWTKQMTGRSAIKRKTEEPCQNPEEIQIRLELPLKFSVMKTLLSSTPAETLVLCLHKGYSVVCKDPSHPLPLACVTQ